MKNGNPDVLGHTPMHAPAGPPGGSVAMLRARLAAQGVRCFANDSLGVHLCADDVAAIENEVAVHVRGMLDALLIDVDGDHNTRDTPARMARMLVRELFAGRYTARPVVMEFPNAAGMNEPYAVGPITVRSTCAHHLCPITGKAWCAVVPGDRLIGLSKFNRLADFVLSRPQIQEEAVAQLADEIENAIKPRGLAVVIRATHSCMTWRGVREQPDAGGGMVTMVTRGELSGTDSRRTVFDLIGGSGF